ncbi:hypothetical protein [Bradyrhizobium sp. dw_78]|nr:hypothetical protein [Bradyrhizobium sp. dw_78]
MAALKSHRLDASLPGLIRQSIMLHNIILQMDARGEPAHDGRRGLLP